MVSSVSGRHLAKRLLNCFHTAHTHSWGGVDVPFGVMTFDLIFDLWFGGDYWLQLIAGDKFSFRTTSRKAFAELFHTAHTHSWGGVDVPFGVMTFDLIFDLWFGGDYWLQLIAGDKFSFRTTSRKASAELFSYCTHKSLRGCRCAFWGYDLWPNFLPLILRRLLTLYDFWW